VDVSQDVQYKDTINLPKTDFPMKADLAAREPLMVADWIKNDIYAKTVINRKDAPNFTMPDGPPYANGGIHMGHTLNKNLKDFVIKYKNLSGKKAVYIPGWDCHGLPIEHKVLKDLAEAKKKAAKAGDSPTEVYENSPKQIRDLCRKEALKWVAHQKAQFQRLGILGDWENPYLTLNSSYEAEEIRELARILKNGILYRGLKPVYWCFALQTALAEAEIEYAPHKSPSVYVKFPFKPSVKFGTFDKPVFTVIWTTTPWSLPSNVALAFNKDFDYTFFTSGNEYWLIARSMKEFFEKETGTTLTDTGKTFKGSDFEMEKGRHPFYERDSLMILGDHVTLDAGTGVVHTAPGHGQDDFIIGNQYGLPVISPLNDKAEFTTEVPEYAGVHVFKANPLIIERLRENGNLIFTKIIEHSYPHNWRSKTPLILRATSQWFIRMDDEKYNVRAKTLAAIEKINFVPDWGVKRLTAMIEGRPDWCISRQRNWGVPIPVFFCGKCGHAHMTEEILYKIADKMENGEGIETYFENTPDMLLGPEKCPKCSAQEWAKGSDILDVWFDSGVCHAAVQGKRDGLDFPADLYLEGSDQHRGWFQTSLISSIASKGQAPFRGLLTHNFVNDDKGRKMSKSLGNYVDPVDLIKSSGAELLRLWTASQDYGQDMNFSSEGFKRISETYRKLRNTYRFLLGNLEDFDSIKDMVTYENMNALDQWALIQLNELIESTTAAYEAFEFYKVYHLINNYFTVTLSAHYLDILKDRLYTWKKTGVARRSAQTVLFEVTSALIRIMAPITSFLAEEVYQFFPARTAESVFLLDFPKPNSQWQNPQISADFAQLFKLRDEVSKQLEEMRQNKVIGANLEARLVLQTSGDEFALLSKYKDDLCEFFIVSQVEIQQGQRNLVAEKARGEKCPRCWYISENIGSNSAHPLLCPKCAGALS
jgi:isoleucyl-tRNA synthetase